MEVPRKARARERMQDTSGSVGSRGAEWEVRPETRVLGPWEREMKEGSKSGALWKIVSIELCCWVWRAWTKEGGMLGDVRDVGVPDVNELSSFSGGGEVVDVDNQRVKGDYLAGVFVRWTCC